MTDHDLPPEPEFRAEMALLDHAMSLARRYLAALNATDHAALNAIMVELAADRDGIALKTFQAMAMQTLHLVQFVDQLSGVELEGGVQGWLDGCALAQLDVVEQNRRDLEAD
jgi:hypothetical protein